MNMPVGLRPYVSAAGVAILSAGLIYVTPHATPHLERRAVQLVATEDFTELFSPIAGEFSAVLPTLSDVSGTFADGASSAADLELLDPAFWQDFWNALLDPDAGSAAWGMLTEALEQLPVIGPLMVGLGGVEFLLFLLFGTIWTEIADALGIEPYAVDAAAAALPGVIDPALSTGFGTALADVGTLFNDAVAVLDPATLVQDVSTALDPAAALSALDFNPIADMSTVIDPALLTDIGTMLSTGAIPDLVEMLTSLIP
jgi:hypothetical protein